MTTYGSCWWLQDHIEFSFGGGVHACCYNYVNSTGHTVGNVLLVNVEDGRFPVDAITAGRRKIHDEIAAGTHSICLGCPVLQYHTWEPRRYLAKFITMNVWSHCNLACYYCILSDPNFKPSHVSYPVISVIGDMLRGEHVDPAGTVTWGGGDISALPEFNDLSTMYLDYGLYQDFKTSAFKFLPGVAASIAKKKGAVEISIDAGTPETYAKVKGKEAFERVVKNVLRYREHGAVNLKYIAGQRNLDDADIEGFVALVDQVKAQSITVTPEWSASWNGDFASALVAKTAKMIFMLSEIGATVVPSNPEDRRRLFPNHWQELDTQLDALKASHRHAELVSGI